MIVIPSGSSKPIDADWLKEYVSDCLAQDDVFRMEFLEAIIFVGYASNDVELSPAVHRLLASWGTKKTEYLAGDSAVYRAEWT